MIMRVLRELGRPRRLHRTRRREHRLTNSRMILGLASWAVGDEPRTHRWYRQAKETKCGETVGGESERLIVPSSRGNRPEGPRGGKGTPSHEPLEGNMTGTPRPEDVFTKQQRIAELARNAPDMAFTNLAHHIDLDWLLTAYYRTRKDGAVGVDGQTADDYEVNLMDNLQNLLDRAKSGTYVAPPVRRVHIPKAGSPGETRPLGIPTYEDKILQRAVLMVLESVYETDFLDVSHGFRPGRGAHGALDTLWKQAMNMGCRWVVDVDLRKFFDSIDHGHLREFLKRRVRDGVILRLIGKWLNAGVLEEGVLTVPDEGTPQGGVISPLLANVVLHYVLDEWFENEVRPRLRGEAFLIRYADDFVIGTTREDDAARIMEVLPKRMSKYGLTVHPEKTRLVRFSPPDAADSEPEERGRTESRTFDFLGFTHYWGRTRQGGWAVKRKTANSRFKRALTALSVWCRNNRHLPVKDQHQTLKQKLQGHYGYYGITGNSACLQNFLLSTRRIWRCWLSRRRRDGPLSWPAFVRLEQSYRLPPARVVHSLLSRVAKS
jgi:RNA-directed DNA polymerase